MLRGVKDGFVEFKIRGGLEKRRLVCFAIVIPVEVKTDPNENRKSWFKTLGSDFLEGEEEHHSVIKHTQFNNKENR